jgi:hypothetical protein
MFHGRGWLRGGGRGAGVASVLVALLALVLLLGAGRDDLGRAAVPRPVRAELTVRAGAPTAGIPRSFLGLSTEYWVLPILARHPGLVDRALSVIRVPGDGPLTVRIGGDSADLSLWDPGSMVVPPWLFAVTPRWVQEASRLVRDLGARLILDLNLAIDSPSAAATWVQAAEARLPARSIAGFEVGNEPDLHTHHFLLGALIPTGAQTERSPLGVTPRWYVRAFVRYARAVAPVAPGVPMLGPVIGNPADAGWIAALVHGAGRSLGAVSAHAYPLSGCVSRTSPGYATVARVLSERASAGVAHGLSTDIQLARRGGVPFRLTELNSVTCGGRKGVSDTFATALWAPDTLFELIRAGVASADIHLRADNDNAPFVIRGDRLVARPLLYGMALFARALGPGARLAPLALHAPGPLHLKAWAVRLADGRLHVLIINKGGRSALVELRLPAIGLASVERLLAPSAWSRSGVTLAGQRLDYHGTWSGRRQIETLVPRAGRYRMLVPGMSAALVSVRLERTNPSRPRAHRSRSPARQ